MSGHIITDKNGNEITEDRIVYEFVQQAFLQAYVEAWQYYAKAEDGKEPMKQFLIIEEINRGNCAQIFGDLFQLLDRNGAGFSDYPIQADNDMRKQLAKAFKDLEIASAGSINDLYNGHDVVGKVLSGEILLLPNNLYIWATMNTSDQSLFPIDSAFKRRWDWKYVPITNAGKGWRISAAGKMYDWWSFLQRVNEQIASTTNSEDKKLGYFFCKATDGVISAETFVGKVIFYLWNDVYKDMYQESGIFKTLSGDYLPFSKFYDEEGDINEQNIAAFLENLGVVEVSEDASTDDFATNNADQNNNANGQSNTRIIIDGQEYSRMPEAFKKMLDVVIEKTCENITSASGIISKIKGVWTDPNVNLITEQELLEQNRKEDWGKYLLQNGEVFYFKKEFWANRNFRRICESFKHLNFATIEYNQ